MRIYMYTLYACTHFVYQYMYYMYIDTAQVMHHVTDIKITDRLRTDYGQISDEPNVYILSIF